MRPFLSPEPPFLLVRWSAKRNYICKRVALGTRMKVVTKRIEEESNYFSAVFSRCKGSICKCPADCLRNIFIFTLITWKSCKVRRHCSEKAGKTPNSLHDSTSVRLVCVPRHLGQSCTTVLFTPKQVVLYSSKVMIQVSSSWPLW